MARETITDKRIKALKAAPEGKRFEIMDAVVPGMAVRVTDRGVKTFVLVGRFPGSSHPTRRALGEYRVLTLEKAREKARQWHELIQRGQDPKEIDRQRHAEEQRRRDTSFGAVAEDYIRLGLTGQRKAATVARELRDEFINDKAVNGKKRAGLKTRAIDSITPHDVVRVIDDAVARGAEYQAHNLLGHIRVMFNWAIARGVYGISTSPCDRMKPKQVIGPKALRTRVLSDDEIRAFWRAASRIGYPYGPLFQLLLITGQRKSEVAEANWSELDFKKRLWVIPPERMKSDSPHVVPLSDEAVSILNDLPRFAGKGAGNFLFSTTNGVKPVNGFSKAKARLDKRMLHVLKAMARFSKADPDMVRQPGFVIHDLRRTMRTGLSGLPVSSDVAELVIAHARPGLRRVYDQFGYMAEKKQALDLWAGRVRGLVTPAPDNVVALQRGRA